MHESNLYPNDPFVTPDANSNPLPPADPFAPAIPQPLPEHPITRAFSSKLFCSIAILYSIYTGLSFFINLLFYQRLTLPLFPILASSDCGLPMQMPKPHPLIWQSLPTV
ncbi:MAG: hypothetical protein E7616_04785 [Ruminococcaceae bacterium]|nr:hypothetical protein [Oscillospiraceae bacterium]